jgi:hypothetical protein
MLGIERTLSQTSTEIFSTHCNMGRTLPTDEPSEPSLCTPTDTLFHGGGKYSLQLKWRQYNKSTVVQSLRGYMR